MTRIKLPAVFMMVMGLFACYTTVEDKMAEETIFQDEILFEGEAQTRQCAMELTFIQGHRLVGTILVWQ